MPTPWWQTAVVYQIYPRSFADTNGDGVGDLEGIRPTSTTSSWLGVDAIWLSPFFRSPMADFGYDVSDYCDVDPLFGTLDDFDRLLADAHDRGIKVIIDWVPNHTSDQHPWFVGRPVEPRHRRSGTGTSGATRPRRRPAEQLGRGLRRRRAGVDLRRGDRPVVPAPASCPSSPT